MPSKLPANYLCILDTITDAEVALESHQRIYSPTAVEIMRDRYRRARIEVLALIDASEAAKRRKYGRISKN